MDQSRNGGKNIHNPDMGFFGFSEAPTDSPETQDVTQSQYEKNPYNEETKAGGAKIIGEATVNGAIYSTPNDNVVSRESSRDNAEHETSRETTFEQAIPSTQEQGETDMFDYPASSTEITTPAAVPSVHEVSSSAAFAMSGDVIDKKTEKDIRENIARLKDNPFGLAEFRDRAMKETLDYNYNRKFGKVDSSVSNDSAASASVEASAGVDTGINMGGSKAA